jgi:hypothetical protein
MYSTVTLCCVAGLTIIHVFLLLIFMVVEIYLGFSWGFFLWVNINYYNNNQAFYFQASWGRLEMKPHEQKKRYKTRVKNKGKTKGDKKTK